MIFEDITIEWDENRSKMVFIYKRQDIEREIDETTLVPDANANLIKILIKKLKLKITIYKSSAL